MEEAAADVCRFHARSGTMGQLPPRSSLFKLFETQINVMRNCVKRKIMAERVVQTCCCCCAPTFHPYVVTCNILNMLQVTTTDVSKYVSNSARNNITQMLCYIVPGRVTYVLTHISSTIIGCANFGPDWPLLFKVHEI